jgi:hypothetical protein
MSRANTVVVVNSAKVVTAFTYPRLPSRLFHLHANQSCNCRPQVLLVTVKPVTSGSCTFPNRGVPAGIFIDLRKSVACL